MVHHSWLNTSRGDVGEHNEGAGGQVHQHVRRVMSEPRAPESQEGPACTQFEK
jgi:hypothetical protein